jgi:hypothetical protein
MVLFPLSLILQNQLIKLLKLGALMPTMSISFRKMVFSTPNISLHLGEGGSILERGGGTEFERARTRGFGSVVRYFIFLIAECVVSRITITAGRV